MYQVSYPLNAGMSSTFPWLSTIAQNYEQWIPHGIVFEFQSTITDTATQTRQIGSVIAVTDYDPNDPPYPTKMEALNSAFATETKQSNNLMCGIECDISDRPTRILFRRTGTLQSGTNLKDYDLGNFQIMTMGGTDPTSTSQLQSIGSLYVIYDIEFLKEEIYSGPYLRAQPYIFARFQAGSTALTTALDPSTWNYSFKNFDVSFASNTLSWNVQTGTRWTVMIITESVATFTAANIADIALNGSGVNDYNSGTFPWKARGLPNALTGQTRFWWSGYAETRQSYSAGGFTPLKMSLAIANVGPTISGSGAGISSGTIVIMGVNVADNL